MCLAYGEHCQVLFCAWYHVQMSAYGQGMQGLGFTESWLMAAGKQLIWQRFLQSKIRKQGRSLQAPPADGDASQVQFGVGGGGLMFRLFVWCLAEELLLVHVLKCLTTVEM